MKKEIKVCDVCGKQINDPVSVYFDIDTTEDPCEGTKVIGRIFDFCNKHAELLIEVLSEMIDKHFENHWKILKKIGVKEQWPKP